MWKFNQFPPTQILSFYSVEYMLGMIRDALSEISMTQNKTDVVKNVAINVVTNEEKTLSPLRQHGKLSAGMLAKSIGITLRQAQ